MAKLFIQYNKWFALLFYNLALHDFIWVLTKYICYLVTARFLGMISYRIYLLFKASTSNTPCRCDVAAKKIDVTR
jgi:hypothetical protein